MMDPIDMLLEQQRSQEPDYDDFERMVIEATYNNADFIALIEEALLDDGEPMETLFEDNI